MPIVYPEVSTSSLKGLSWSGCASTGSDVTRRLSVWNVLSSSVIHHQGVSLRVSLLRDRAWVAKPQIKMR